MKRSKTALSILVLCVLYLTVLLGTTAFNTDFIHFTPLLLLISAFVLFFNHARVDSRFVVYATVVFIGGWIIEWAGVETGKVFGQYFFGNNLGYKMLDVPIIIGMIWLLLTYCSSVIAHRLCSKSSMLNKWLPKALLAAVLVVLVVVFVEQIAPVYDFWYWKNQTVPLQNYTAWFAFAFAFNYLFQRLEIHSENPAVIWLYGLMLVFFAALSMLPEMLFT